LAKDPKAIQLDDEQYEGLCARLEKNEITDQDRHLLVELLSAMRWLSRQLELGRLSIRRLKALIFGKKTESRKNILKDKPPQSNDGAVSCGNPEPEPQPAQASETEASPPNPPKPGHGRKSHDAYTGAERTFCAHCDLKPGDICPACGKGKLHDSVKPGVFIQFTGSPLIQAHVFETQKLRCCLCGKIFEAPLPEGVKAERWGDSAKTITALSRYGYGFPHFRLERFQADIGVPVSDSVAFELANQVADCAFPVFRHLVYLAADGELIHYDDTTARILSLIQENKGRDPDKERVGMFTTAMLAKAGEREIALFFTGRNHAGENITDLLRKRTPGLKPPLLMSDGLSRNPPPKEFEVILGNCLTHARRGFVDIKDEFPKEIEYVIDIFADIYHLDAVAKQEGMNDSQRLKFHQENSGPLMEALRAWGRDQLEARKVEPNGPLGKAILYMEKRWAKLTRFLTIPGAPLSNDIVERTIKTCVLHRKNSLFYKTEHGAIVGDILMTVIHSAVRAKQSPFHYLNTIQQYRREAHQDPAAWLPWSYITTLESRSPPHDIRS
jgi:transposase